MEWTGIRPRLFKLHGSESRRVFNDPIRDGSARGSSWNSSLDRSKNREGKGEGYVLIRRERKGEGGFFPVREIGFSDLFCLQCLLDGVRGKEGVVVAVVSGEEFREGGLV